MWEGESINCKGQLKLKLELQLNLDQQQHKARFFGNDGCTIIHGAFVKDLVLIL